MNLLIRRRTSHRNLLIRESTDPNAYIKNQTKVRVYYDKYPDFLFAARKITLKVILQCDFLRDFWIMFSL